MTSWQSLQSTLETLINFPAYMYVTNTDQYNTVTEVNKVIASCQVYKKAQRRLGMRMLRLFPVATVATTVRVHQCRE